MKEMKKDEGSPIPHLRFFGVWLSFGSLDVLAFMKCSNHTQADAVATCVFCGQGLCPSCVTRSSSGRAVCSPRCAERVSAMETALETIHQKGLASTRGAAYFLIAGGLLFACVGIFEIIKAISTGKYWAMTFFMPGIAVVFIVTGILLLRVLKKKI